MSTVGELWFIRIRGQVRGPYSQEQLRILVRRGAFGRSHEVSQDRATWRRASILTDLFSPPPTAAVGGASAHVSPSAPINTMAVMTPAAPAAPEDDIQLSLGPEPREESRWYVIQNGEPQGPLSESDMRQRAAEGTLRPDDRVWSDGAADWSPAASFGRFTFAAPAVSRGEPNRAAVAAPYARGMITARESGAAPFDANRNASSADISLLFGILGWTILPVIGSVVAVILGHSVADTAKRAGASVPGGAVAGLILGYSAMAIAAVGGLVLYAVLLR